MQNFWKKLNTPFFCLAPMEEVTDVAFREMFARYSGQNIEYSTQNTVDSRIQSADSKQQGKIGNRQEIIGGHQADIDAQLLTNSYQLGTNHFVMFTEFVNVDGILHPEGFQKLKQDLYFTEIQRPIVAQLWGNNPEKFFEATQLVKKMGFDGVDINMGCPQEKEIKINSCAALIRDPKLAGEIIQATKEGWLKNSSLEKNEGVPVSVKTRIGYSKPDVENWIGFLLTHNLSAITVHGRTKKEMSKVPANWDEIKKAVELRNSMQVSEIASATSGPFGASEAISGQDRLSGSSQSNQRTLIIGNGDVKSYAEGLKRVEETGVDGVMIARGAFGNPWLFDTSGKMPDAKEKLRVMLEHAEIFQKWLPLKSFQIMRKHFKAYASGFDGANELRVKLMETKNLEETKKIVEEFLK
jgi:tRNA-dihydrouridine synthase